ncbi:hypothetical protein NPIL_40581 [Nephila pilipes]|uniref:Uncharacterized protein n=1 Tax=Nephila pilipes TaxID=299642 RepID=A0A8X6Q5K9_NEPPI|nr:hypothetical protein NPIL_40581 [Nephila pilipes]
MSRVLSSVPWLSTFGKILVPYCSARKQGMSSSLCGDVVFLIITLRTFPKRQFEPSSRIRFIELWNELQGIKFKDGDNVGLFISLNKNLVQQFKDIDREAPLLYQVLPHCWYILDPTVGDLVKASFFQGLVIRNRSVTLQSSADSITFQSNVKTASPLQDLIAVHINVVLVHLLLEDSSKILVLNQFVEMNFFKNQDCCMCGRKGRCFRSCRIR